MMDYDENGYLLFTLKNGSKNDWKLIIGVGEGVRGGLEKRCQMSWVEKNRKINNRGGPIIRDSKVVRNRQDLKH